VSRRAADMGSEPLTWWRIEVGLDTPAESGENVIRLWINLPASVDPATSAALYREGMFQRLEAMLHSEIKSLGHPRDALLEFTIAMLAHNVLSLLLRVIDSPPCEQAYSLRFSGSRDRCRYVQARLGSQAPPS